MRLRLASTLALAAVVIAPGTAGAQFDNSIPVRNLTGSAPIVVTETSVFFPQPANGKVRVCVSFRNVTAKPASEIEFTFRFDDMLHNPLREAILHRTGSFGPGILIEGKMSALGGSPDSFNNCVLVDGTSIKPSLEIVDETAVVFEDGTTWKKGMPFVAAFSRAGTRLAGAGQTVGGSAPGTPPAGATVTVGGATAQGGIIAGAGAAFGTIAWIPGSRTAVATAVDAPSQDVADYAAMSKCNSLAPGGAGCTVRVRMSGADKRCGVVATDDVRFSTSSGPNMNDTIKAALDALQAQGGTLGPNNIVASGCNTR
ncbi:MAG TPA: DUF4189 domain-containing protein [Candidatus Elarobacter sp.]|nr:DUF4189 domain-containing protein [Candidatus Elarobacter sp.]